MNAWMRGDWELPKYAISKESDLNQTGLIVAVYRGSGLDTYATANLTASTVVRTSSYIACFSMILNGEAHVMLGDASEIRSYSLLNPCPNCTFGTFSTPYGFGSFTSNTIATSESVGYWKCIERMMILTVFVVLTLFLI